MSDAEAGAITLESREARSGFVGSLRRSPKSPNDAMQPVPPPPPPAPKRRRHGRLVIIGSALFTTVLLFMAIATAGIHLLASRLHAPGPLAVDKAVVIRGSSASDITETLLNEQVIDSGIAFWIGVKMLGVDQHLHKGEFLFPAKASIEGVIDILVEGKTIDRFVTIPEGKTSEEVVAILRANEDLTGEIKEIPKEGSLLPDTYKVTRGDQRAKIIAWMADAQRTALADIWKHRSADLPIRTAQELVILASIVEKETGKADERPRVAGVFLNRLQKNIRLQSDPTIVYGLTGGKGPLGRQLTKDDVAKLTPYNTYAIDGLPPGPIANPGKAAMEAVANPSRTKELYFVADGTGGHVFAETLDQHNRNVARWRQIEADRAAAGAQQPGQLTPGAAPVAQGGAAPAGGALPSTSFGVPSLGTPGVGAPGAPGGAPVAPAPPPAPLKPGQKRSANVPTSNGRGLPPAANAYAEPEPTARGGSLASYPVSPAMRAKMEREAAAAGVKLAPGSTVDPNALMDPNASADGSDVPMPASTPATTVPLRSRGFDAVAGTAKDPLNNKTFDLNSPHTVPNLK